MLPDYVCLDAKAFFTIKDQEIPADIAGTDKIHIEKIRGGNAEWHHESDCVEGCPFA